MGCSPTVPCSPWADIADFCGPCGDKALENPTLFQEMLDVATATVFRLTMSRYTGECTTTILPCRKNSCCPTSYNGPWGHLQYPSYVFSRGDTIYNSGCPTDCFSDDCDCSGADCITLPYYPVCSIDAVVVDGVTLDPSEYYIKKQKYLCRKDGLWPTCQDISKDLSQPGTWGVTFTHGIDPPIDLVRHTVDYACELAKRCLNEPCLLPQKITVQSGQVVVDPLVYVMNGLTGWAPLDAVIRGMNKTGALRPGILRNPRKRRNSHTIAYP